MQDHTIAVDWSPTPAGIRIAPVFNMAAYFIDRHLAEGRAAKIAVRTAREDVSYALLAENVNRAGNALAAMGLGAGDRVLMVVKDCPAFFYLFWGAIKAGFVPVPLNTLLRAADYRPLIEDSGARALAYSPEYAAEVEPAAQGLAVQAFRTEGAGGLAARMGEASPTLAPAPAAPDDEAFWLYSSGSTGRPKGAVHRHRDYVYSCVYYASAILGLSEDDSCFSAAKLFFAYGLGNAMVFPLWAGATAILSDERPSPETTFATIAGLRPTVYFGVPTLYAAQLRALETGSADLASLRICISAGEALPADLLNRWQARVRVPILDGIGSTEINHIYISNRIDDVRPGSTGRLVPGYEVKILGEDGRPAPPDDVGRLWVWGKSIAKYYWNNPQKTAEIIHGEWIDTGDSYSRDADGYYTYCGRSDDMMKVGGIWCSPFEIEAKLIEHPLVFEAAVVARADESGLIKPAAYIVLKDPKTAGEAAAAALRAHCKTGLAPYKFPRWFEFVAELPKTATGKIQRFKLRAS